MTVPTGGGGSGSAPERVWSVHPVRMVLPVSQWAGLLASRDVVDVPRRFAVRPGEVRTGGVEPAGAELGARQAQAVGRMLDVVDAAPVRVHVGSWGRGRAASAVVCVGGDRVVTLASAGPDPARGGGVVGAPPWVEVSAVWGGDVLAEVMRAGHPDLDAGSSAVAGGAADVDVDVDAVGSLAWATAMRDGDTDTLRVLLSRDGLAEVPVQVRAAVDGLVGATGVRVEVRPGSARAGSPGVSWFGLWLATQDGTLAMRPGLSAGPSGGSRDGERVRLWWAAPGEVSRDVVAALAGAHDAVDLLAAGDGAGGAR